VQISGVKLGGIGGFCGGLVVPQSVATSLGHLSNDNLQLEAMSQNSPSIPLRKSLTLMG